MPTWRLGELGPCLPTSKPLGFLSLDIPSKRPSSSLRLHRDSGLALLAVHLDRCLAVLPRKHIRGGAAPLLHSSTTTTRTAHCVYVPKMQRIGVQPTRRGAAATLQYTCERLKVDGVAYGTKPLRCAKVCMVLRWEWIAPSSVGLRLTAALPAVAPAYAHRRVTHAISLTRSANVEHGCGCQQGRHSQPSVLPSNQQEIGKVDRHAWLPIWRRGGRAASRVWRQHLRVGASRAIGLVDPPLPRALGCATPPPWWFAYAVLQPAAATKCLW